jgi:hypothetical protein
MHRVSAELKCTRNMYQRLCHITTDMTCAYVTFYGIMGNYAEAQKPVIILILIKAYVITSMLTCMHETRYTVRPLTSRPGDQMYLTHVSLCKAVCHCADS